ncbi:MAG TPA: universal stress protein [Puia sp.]|jgi:nucleotide-binding universal stress UspA family protein
MKTLLVPVDFSASTNNAAAYAVGLANDLEFNEIILVANLFVPLFEQIIPTPDLTQISESDIKIRIHTLRQQLEELKLDLLKKLHPAVTVRVVISELTLVRSIVEQVIKNKPDLVLIGSSNTDIKDDSIIGRQVIELTKVIPVPVLIVPGKSSYQPIADVLVACEFISFTCLDPLQRLGKVNLWRHPRLLLLNLDPAKRDLHSDKPFAKMRDVVRHLPRGFKFEFDNLPDAAILPGIIKFSEEKKVQLIVALAGKHSFLYNLTHRSLLQQLSSNSLKPVLVLK